MNKDIENREDIYLLVKDFYVKLMNDDLMHHFFEEFTNPELLEKHLQILVALVNANIVVVLFKRLR